MTPSTIRKRLLLAIAACSLVLASGGTAFAQEYPAKPVRLVSPYAPGGSTGVVARILAKKFQDQTGISMVVENRPGAASNIGSDHVAKSTPDGYTLLMGTSSLAINPALYRTMTFDPIKDLAPVVPLITAPNVLAVDASLPVRSVKELIDYARANPGKLNYASPGAGNLLHVAMEALRQQAGINMVHVPYKATPQMVSDLIGGQVDLALLVPSTGLPQIKSGKLKALGLTVDERLTAAPEITPLSDSPELKGYFVTTSIGLFVPARTPQAIIDRLNRELNAILASPEVRKPFEDQAATVGKGSGADYAEFLRKELARNAVVVKAANIKGE